MTRIRKARRFAKNYTRKKNVEKKLNLLINKAVDSNDQHANILNAFEKFFSFSQATYQDNQEYFLKSS